MNDQYNGPVHEAVNQLEAALSKDVSLLLATAKDDVDKLLAIKTMLDLYAERVLEHAQAVKDHCIETMRREGKDPSMFP